ncbi:Uncharacterised protein [Mycoplasmopsis maculosa]|uniref:Uncharacterized protein n=1 Tax=Mycoplasmopsis maculosa TaxID=114885 RepID=A0A449B3Q4_9BACT|nr:hypothetical protein [Mycoplasmopsis maculosa]VEU75199.1 Uncharacterised protein [Mycoplasmopsis maculosa]
MNKEIFLLKKENADFIKKTYKNKIINFNEEKIITQNGIKVFLNEKIIKYNFNKVHENLNDKYFFIVNKIIPRVINLAYKNIFNEDNHKIDETKIYLIFSKISERINNYFSFIFDRNEELFKFDSLFLIAYILISFIKSYVLINRNKKFIFSLFVSLLLYFSNIELLRKYESESFIELNVKKIDEWIYLSINNNDDILLKSIIDFILDNGIIINKETDTEFDLNDEDRFNIQISLIEKKYDESEYKNIIMEIIDNISDE